MEKQNPRISLIIPCYNEQSNIQKGVLDKFGNYTESDNRFVEIIIVDDGSNDESKSIIKKTYLTQFPKFRLVENDHLGKAFAIITGIHEAKGDFVMFSDIDLATPVEEAEKLITQINAGHDIVIGSRKSTRAGAPIARKILAYGFIIIRNFLIGLKGIHDTQCGFKIFKKTAADTILSNLRVFKNPHVISGSSVSAGFDLEFLFLAKKQRYKIKEVDVAWRHVETKNVNFIKDAIESMKDIIKIKYFDLTGKYNL